MPTEEVSTFSPEIVDLFEKRIGRPSAPSTIPELVEYIGEGLDSSPESRTPEMWGIHAATSLLVERLASYPHQDECFSIEARAFTEVPQRADTFRILSEMPIVPRNGETVPTSLCGMLELMLRAGDSGARLGPAHFGLGGLSEETWMSLRIAARRGMTSHALLTIWAALGEDPDVALPTE